MGDARTKVAIEKRAHERIDTRLPGELRVHFHKDQAGPRAALSATILDYSTGGARVSVRVGSDAVSLIERLQKEQAFIACRVTIPSAPALTLIGEARWAKLTSTSDGAEIGLRFIDLEENALSVLGQLSKGEPIARESRPALGWVAPALILAVVALALFLGARVLQESRRTVLLETELLTANATRELTTAKMRDLETKLKEVEAKLREARLLEAKLREATLREAEANDEPTDGTPVSE